MNPYIKHIPGRTRPDLLPRTVYSAVKIFL